MSFLFKYVLFLSVFSSVCTHAQNISLDKKLGEETALQVEQELGLYHHDSLEWLVNRVGKKLVSRLKSNPFEYKFFLVDSDIPNAFAIPGGNIYLSRGIFSIIQNEDELAGIMAHEIIHVAQRHSVKQLKKSRITGILKVPGNLLNAITGTSIGNVLNVPIGFTTSAYSAKHSRGHETEADKYGIQLAASAGYKTEGLADALERLAMFVELLTGEAENQNYLSDHPYTPSRVSSVRKMASLYPPVKPSPIVATHENFLKKMDALCFGPNPAQGIFIDSLFIHPDLNIAWIVPSGWATINKPVLVAAHSPKGDALVAMRVSDQKDVHAIGSETSKKLAAKAGITIDAARDTTINAVPAYVLRMHTIESKQVVISEMIWVKHNNMVLELIGVGSQAAQKEMHTALCKIRESTPAEENQLISYNMRIVSAKAGETIEQLSVRTGNRLVPEITSVINDHRDQKAFTEGENVKIVTATPYSPM